jgi:phosphoribosyl-ATP pyrophosphohydrolase/phosphoribosyl-AMP cyclohydrolase
VTIPQPPALAPLSLDGIETLDFGESGLIPVVVQDRRTGEVRMVAFTNREMLAKTLETGNAHFWSRTRQQPWLKGETSGNFIRVTEVRRNCEDNSLLYLADPIGPTCHTGEQTCFYRTLAGQRVPRPSFLVSGADLPTRNAERETRNAAEGGLDWLFAIVRDRQQKMPEGSYTTTLLRQGVDRIAKKVGEEAAEVIIAAKNRSREELAREMADLWYHALVLLADAGMAPEDVYQVLAERHASRLGAQATPGDAD